MNSNPVQGGVPFSRMTEEPMREEESEESSLVERMRRKTKNIQDRFARGGIFLFAIFFVVGIIFGVSAKTLAGKSITIGYWDYTVSQRESSAIDLNAVQTRLLAKTAEEAKKQESAPKEAEGGGNVGSENSESPTPVPSEEPEE